MTSQDDKTPVQAPSTPRDCASRLGRTATGHGGPRFAVLLNCIDGRAQQPAAAWVRENLDVEFVDVVTEPGVDAVLARGQEATREALLDKVCVSRIAHGAVGLVVAGHHDCAANPGDAEAHAQDITRAVDALRKALPEIPVQGLYIDATWTARGANN